LDIFSFAGGQLPLRKIIDDMMLCLHRFYKQKNNRQLTTDNR